MSSIKHTFECWHEGLISTSEILARILTSDLPVVERLEHIATVTLILNEQEQAEADAAYPDPDDIEWLADKQADEIEERDYREALIEDAKRSKNEL